MEKNYVKKQRGITLVALVVTIVILLILAGVTISSVIGDNGLISVSKQKTASAKEKIANEVVKRLVMEYKIGNNGESLEDYLKARVPDRIDDVTRVDDNTLKVKKDGYEIIVDEEKQEGKLVLSETSGNYTYPVSGIFLVIENTGDLSVNSSNNNIVTASIKGKEITVVPGTTEGIAIITVTSGETKDYRAKTAIYTATVNNGTITLSATPYSGTYDGQTHNAITNVSVNPSDAKIEYSTNGTDYSTIMPTITNTSSFTVTVRASKEGYKTQTVTQTTKVNKANGNLTLSATSGTITYPNSTSFTVSNNTGSLSVSTSNSNIASASISGNTVTVKAIAKGTATITVTSSASTNYTEKTATYSVTVKNSTFTEDSGVGYYADVDDDGTVDGIIFEDFKKGGSGKWGSSKYASYTISTVSSTKSYYISQSSYSGPFGTKPVLAPTGSGNARFYVMALSDYINGATYKFTDAKAITSGEWSTPSKNEWAAFGGELGITTSNYSGYGLKDKYWSSSDLSNIGSGYFAHFSSGLINYNIYAIKYPVRLARTF